MRPSPADEGPCGSTPRGSGPRMSSFADGMACVLQTRARRQGVLCDRYKGGPRLGGTLGRAPLALALLLDAYE